MKLAWLWSYANTAGENPRLTVDELKQLVESLDEPERLLAMNYLAAQAESMQPEVRAFTEGFASRSEAYARAIEEGRANRQPRGNGRFTWSYPSEQFLPGTRTSIYESLLTYQTVVLPVAKGLEQIGSSDGEERSITFIMGRPLINNER